MNIHEQFIIIDDDTTSTLIGKYMIRQVLGEIDILTFTEVEKGIDYLKSTIINPEKAIKHILLLDINMPFISGWDALNIINKLDDGIKNLLTIFMLSSSIDPKDKQRAMDHPLVKDYIEKPLTALKLNTSLNKLILISKTLANPV
ncbi:MAG: response regulator [Pyrinomonadaceae bacterium]|nr:response regulator [Sphingobacteriaceae bacterium]